MNGDPNPNRPDLRPYEAGEAAIKPLLAAIANAIYDATGVRIRRVPFRDARVLAALKAAGVQLGEAFFTEPRPRGSGFPGIDAGIPSGVLPVRKKATR
ncbi:MAG TPA: hypothetical protein VN633_24505 [Bryobacteraceae bacterium]|nr:hypothetical protein [Bryobacteraceae bacterium]